MHLVGPKIFLEKFHEFPGIDHHLHIALWEDFFHSGLLIFLIRVSFHWNMEEKGVITELFTITEFL